MHPPTRNTPDGAARSTARSADATRGMDTSTDRKAAATEEVMPYKTPRGGYAPAPMTAQPSRAPAAPVG